MEHQHIRDCGRKCCKKIIPIQRLEHDQSGQRRRRCTNADFCPPSFAHIVRRTSHIKRCCCSQPMEQTNSIRHKLLLLSSQLKPQTNFKYNLCAPMENSNTINVRTSYNVYMHQIKSVSMENIFSCFSIQFNPN